MNRQNIQEWPWLGELIIDRNDPAAPVEQLANALRNKIATGQVTAGDSLPSVRKLAAEIGATSATVSRAYQLLQREGLLTAVTGAGTRVADVENLQASARSGMLEAAGQVLDRTLNSLASLGLDADDLDHLLRERSGLLPVTQLNLVFIARRHTNLVLYQKQLSRTVSGLPVRVTCIPLEDLENGDAQALRTVDAADVITSVVTYRRRLAGCISRADEARYIIAEVAMQAVEELLNLPATAQLALVMSESFRTVGLGILHTYCPPERISVVRDIHDPDVLRAIPADTVIVHSYQQKDLISETLADRHSICMDFHLREDSLARLREFLQEQLAMRTTLPDLAASRD